METKGVSKTCCCCLLRASHRDMERPYSQFGLTEIYSDMLADCFGIHVIQSDNESGICEVCMGCLQDACNFKQQVQRSQLELRTRLAFMMQCKDDEPEIKAEMSECQIQGSISYSPVKSEASDVLSDGDPCFFGADEAALDPSQTVPVESSYSEEHSETISARLKRRRRDDPKQGQMSQTLPELTNPHYNSKIPQEKKKPQQTKVETGNDSNANNLSSRVYIKDECKQDQKYFNNTGTYSCDVCHVVVATKQSMACHMRKHKEPSSQICRKRPKRKTDLCYNTWTCDVCEKKFQSKWSLKLHNINLHSKEKFKCEYCSKQFKSINYLNIHKRKHTGPQNTHCCETCGKKFTSKLTISNHSRYHTGDMPFTCDICMKRFFSKSALTYHISNTHSEKTFICKKCGKTFKSRLSYNRHESSVHIERKIFPCEICKKQFRRRQHLQRHRTLHTGEKSFVCETCGKKFFVAYNLKVHLLTHVKGQTFACALCSKSYSTKESLRQHKRVHLSKKDVRIVKENRRTDTNFNG